MRVAGKYLLVGSDHLIDSAVVTIQMIVAGNDELVRSIVGTIGHIRQREECVERFDRSWIQAVAEIRRHGSCAWVERGRGQDAGTLGGGREYLSYRKGLRAPGAFVGKVKERLVFAVVDSGDGDGTA